MKVATVVASIFAALAAMLINASANTALEGEWIGPERGGGEMRAVLKVRGNEIEGEAKLIPAKRSGGDISGSISNDSIHLRIRWKNGNIVEYDLKLIDDKLMKGVMKFHGETEVELRKVSQ